MDSKLSAHSHTDLDASINRDDSSYNFPAELREVDFVRRNRPEVLRNPFFYFI